MSMRKKDGDNNIVTHMSDAEIRAVFEGTVCMTSEVAQDLIERGYGELLGVLVKEWEVDLPKGEMFAFDNSATCTKQKDSRMIKVENDKVETLSWLYRPIDGEKKKLSPAVTVLDRGDGKLYTPQPRVEKIKPLIYCVKGLSMI